MLNCCSECFLSFPPPVVAWLSPPYLWETGLRPRLCWLHQAGEILPASHSQCSFCAVSQTLRYHRSVLSGCRQPFNYREHCWLVFHSFPGAMWLSFHQAKCWYFIIIYAIDRNILPQSPDFKVSCRAFFLKKNPNCIPGYFISDLFHIPVCLCKHTTKINRITSWLRISANDTLKTRGQPWQTIQESSLGWFFRAMMVKNTGP